MTEDTESRQPAPPPPPPPKERAKASGGGLDPDAWMITFSDLLTLLMTFFVLMFASADPVDKKIQEAFGQRPGVLGMFRRSVLDQVTIVPRQDVSQDRLQVFLDTVGAVDVELKQEERGLVVTLPTDAYFQPGSTRLNARALRRIGQLAEFLRATAHPIRVEGHSDNQETGAPRLDSPWDLSLARADAVLQRLLGAGIRSERLSLVGYGPSRPRHDNASRLGRARNRRVEIVILNRKFTAP